MFIINFCLNMFRASLCPSLGEQRPCYCIWCIVLVLLDVVSSGCGALRCRMRALLASYNAAPHNRYQPHPEEPEQYTKCSNTVFVLLKMVIMKNVETEVNNKYLIVASRWLFLSLHTFSDNCSQPNDGQKYYCPKHVVDMLCIIDNIVVL